MNKHVNKVRKATGRAEAITAGRQHNKQQYLIIQLMKKKESIKFVLLYFSKFSSFIVQLHSVTCFYTINECGLRPYVIWVLLL